MYYTEYRRMLAFDSGLDDKIASVFNDLSINKDIVDRYNEFADIIKGFGIKDEGFVRQIFNIYMDGYFGFPFYNSKAFAKNPNKAFFYPMKAKDYSRVQIVPYRTDNNTVKSYLLRYTTDTTDRDHYKLSCASYKDMAECAEKGQSVALAFDKQYAILKRHSQYDYDNVIAAIQLILNAVYGKQLSKFETLSLYSYYVKHHYRLRNSKKHNLPFADQRGATSWSTNFSSNDI